MVAVTSHLLVRRGRNTVARDIHRGEKETAGHPEEECGEHDNVAYLLFLFNNLSFIYI
jgi:hypothetical protein